MADDMNCSKCGGALVEGFVIDRTHGGAKAEQTWVEGVPESSFWSNGLKTSGRAIYNVRTMRCAGCGFLESYADSEVNAGSGLGELFGA